MSTCINCGYELVLLSNRPKYKCALCSKLFPQKEIENKTFRLWNEKQRGLDIHNYKLERREKLSNLRRLRLSIRKLFKPLKCMKEYYKKRYIQSKPARESWVKTNTVSVDYKGKFKQRLAYYRAKQKELAQLNLKNYNKGLSIQEIFKSPPTFVHS